MKTNSPSWHKFSLPKHVKDLVDTKQYQAALRLIARPDEQQKNLEFKLNRKAKLHCRQSEVIDG